MTAERPARAGAPPVGGPEPSQVAGTAVSARGAPASDGAELASRVGASRWLLTLDAAEMVNLSTRRLLLSSPELASLVYQPGQDLMLTVGQSASGHVRRRYTIRSFSRPRAQVAVDVILHGNGAGKMWAEAASVGDTVEAIGPRGKITVQQGAPWHLFAGDEAFAPAALTMAEALAGGDSPTFVLIVVSAKGHEHATTLAGASAPTWLYRRPDVSDGALLAGALKDVCLPAGAGTAYLGGELGTVAAARTALVDRGLSSEQVLAKAYWRAGMANAPHGEPERG